MNFDAGVPHETTLCVNKTKSRTACARVTTARRTYMYELCVSFLSAGILRRKTYHQLHIQAGTITACTTPYKQPRYGNQNTNNSQLTPRGVSIIIITIISMHCTLRICICLLPVPHINGYSLTITIRFPLLVWVYTILHGVIESWAKQWTRFHVTCHPLYQCLVVSMQAQYLFVCNECGWRVLQNIRCTYTLYK